MQLTAAVLDAEATIRTLLTSTPGWDVWRDDRTRRNPDRPTFIANHPGHHITLAIYVRPRRLRPTETPTSTHSPAGTRPVVWHPQLADDIEAWLHHPTPDTPGLLPHPDQDPGTRRERSAGPSRATRVRGRTGDRGVTTGDVTSEDTGSVAVAIRR
ncbi:hypothetical protein [Cellulomonas sp. ATA003]|uniref:hypothetical protein n=1 Tax=Cellulomonas sp. ATA003 TaxID=3073064 RepID=UPI0028733243|nr:hypothetical protein [Cellulomonas sp. ATA003]WNB84528.1 hypothetical protein REH70_11875 [Cellulomonas sp. ATA003]